MDKLREEYQLDLRVLGVASSKSMLLSESAMDLTHWRQDMADKVRRRGGGRVVQRVVCGMCGAAVWKGVWAGVGAGLIDAGVVEL